MMTSLGSFLPFPLQSYRRHNTAGFTGRAGREITPRLLPGEQEIQPARHKMVLLAKLFVLFTSYWTGAHRKRSVGTFYVITTLKG